MIVVNHNYITLHTIMYVVGFGIWSMACSMTTTSTAVLFLIVLVFCFVVRRLFVRNGQYAKSRLGVLDVQLALACEASIASQNVRANNI